MRPVRVRTPRRASTLLVLFLCLIFVASCGEPADEAIESERPQATVTPLPIANRKSDVSASIPDERHYTSPDLGFSVAYPGDWLVNDTSAEENGVILSDPNDEAIFWVQRDDFGGGPERANGAAIAWAREILEESAETDAVRYAGDPVSFRLAGLNGLTLDYEFTDSDAGEIQGSFIAVTTDNGKTYLVIIEATADRYEETLGIFDAMLQSFRISGVPVGPSAPVVAPPAERTEAEWLVMFYFDADDATLERDIMVDLNEIERVGSTDQVHMVAQVDRYVGGFSGMGDWTTTKRFYLLQDDDLGELNSPELADLGELNMADGETLTDFIVWAVVNYPARKHMLIFSDHGMGWPGGFSDPDPGGQGAHDLYLAAELEDNLWLMEIDEALGEARAITGLDKFELIGFDACLMAQLEVFSALVPHARYAVASEELEPAVGWAYTSFLGQLTANPSMNGADVGRAIVETYIDEDQRIVDEAARRQFMREYEFEDGPEAFVEELSQDITLSVVDLSAIPALNEAVGRFGEALLTLDRRTVSGWRVHSQTFENVFDPDLPSPYIDLGHFAAKAQAKSNNADVEQAAGEVLEALQEAVVAERHGPKRPGATGIALYFPNREIYGTNDNWEYTTIAARFAEEYSWDDFLDEFYAGRKRGRFSSRSGGRSDVGATPIRIEPVRLSAEFTSIDQPVNIQTEISGDDIGYIYSFVGRILPEEQVLIIEDIDYLFADETQELNGVVYPVWPEGDIAIDFDWAPIVYGIHDGTTTVRALIAPDTYGETPTYVVEGTYHFADGSPSRFARLYFQDGELVDVFVSTGSTGLGAMRAITPQIGDQFTVHEKGRRLDSGREQFSREGGTLTFGEQNFFIEEMPAPGGSYTVGFIVEDLDGRRVEQFESLFVENEAVEGEIALKPYTNEALGFSLLYPESWTVEEDDEAEIISFVSDSSSAEVLVIRSSYLDAQSSQEANETAIEELIAILSEDGELEELEFVTEIEEYILGAFDALTIDFTLSLDGEPFYGTIIVATPEPGATYAFIATALDGEFEAAWDELSLMIENFDILVSGVSKVQDGPPPPDIAEALFFDEFDDPDSGLGTFDGEWGESGYSDDGRYFFELTPYAGPIYTYYPDATLPETFILQTTAAYEGAAENAYGLVFQVIDDEHFYLFRVSGDGFYTIEMVEGDELISLVDWTPYEIDGTPGAPNVLTVVGRGDSYAFYINGRRVDRIQDGTYSGGSYGVVADNYNQEAEVTLTFDDLLVGSPVE